MSHIPFTKMHGAGNDFILIDNRRRCWTDTTAATAARVWCPRQTGIGADGLILLDDSPSAAFRMRHYNVDGSRASFCGNGARCLTRYAYQNGLTGRSMTFEADDGLHQAEVLENGVALVMSTPRDIHLNRTMPDDTQRCFHTVYTGVEHAVFPSDDIEAEAVEITGARLRHHAMFEPGGMNINFVEMNDDASLSVRTYERGVEAETLSCGTGAVASAVVHALIADFDSPVEVRTRSGESLEVSFLRENEDFSQVVLTGSAHRVFSGEVCFDD